jgi:hypothetical protein
MGTPEAFLGALLLSIAQSVLFFARDRTFKAFPVQLRLAYTVLLMPDRAGRVSPAGCGAGLCSIEAQVESGIGRAEGLSGDHSTCLSTVPGPPRGRTTTRSLR